MLVRAAVPLCVCDVLWVLLVGERGSVSLVLPALRAEASALSCAAGLGHSGCPGASHSDGEKQQDQQDGG